MQHPGLSTVLSPQDLIETIKRQKEQGTSVGLLKKRRRKRKKVNQLKILLKQNYQNTLNIYNQQPQLSGNEEQQLQCTAQQQRHTMRMHNIILNNRKNKVAGTYTNNQKDSFENNCNRAKEMISKTIQNFSQFEKAQTHHNSHRGYWTDSNFFRNISHSYSQEHVTLDSLIKYTHFMQSATKQQQQTNSNQIKQQLLQNTILNEQLKEKKKQVLQSSVVQQQELNKQLHNENDGSNNAIITPSTTYIQLDDLLQQKPFIFKQEEQKKPKILFGNNSELKSIRVQRSYLQQQPNNKQINLSFQDQCNNLKTTMAKTNLESSFSPYRLQLLQPDSLTTDSQSIQSEEVQVNSNKIKVQNKAMEEFIKNTQKKKKLMQNHRKIQPECQPTEIWKNIRSRSEQKNINCQEINLNSNIQIANQTPFIDQNIKNTNYTRQNDAMNIKGQLHCKAQQSSTQYQSPIRCQQIGQSPINNHCSKAINLNEVKAADNIINNIQINDQNNNIESFPQNANKFKNIKDISEKEKNLKKIKQNLKLIIQEDTQLNGKLNNVKLPEISVNGVKQKVTNSIDINSSRKNSTTVQPQQTLNQSLVFNQSRKQCEGNIIESNNKCKQMLNIQNHINSRMEGYHQQVLVNTCCIADASSVEASPQKPEIKDFSTLIQDSQVKRLNIGDIGIDKKSFRQARQRSPVIEKTGKCILTSTERLREDNQNNKLKTLIGKLDLKNQFIDIKNLISNLKQKGKTRQQKTFKQVRFDTNVVCLN